MGTPAIVRDRREHGFFCVDNEILDLHSEGEHYKDLGPFALLVYIVLCRHARNGTQECSVLRETIGEKARISKTSVTRGINELEKCGLIAVERSNKKASVYTLLPVVKSDKNRVPIGLENQNGVPIGLETPNRVLLGTHNKTKILTKLHPSDDVAEKPAPSKKGRTKKPADPRMKDFMPIIHAVQRARTGIFYSWMPGDYAALKHLLQSSNLLTAEILKDWLQHYWNSTNINSADPPRVYLSKLVRYRNGPLNEFGLLKDARARSAATAAVVEEVESPVHKLRRQLQGR